MFKRNLFEKLKKLISWSPVVLLVGAQKTGKTTLIKKVCSQAVYTYLNFEDEHFVALAKNDPVAFIESLSKPVILDKIERVPELFSVIKKDVQKNRQSRMYVLISSVDLLLIPEFSDLVVGQMETRELFTFTQGECIELKENFIETLFRDKKITISSDFCYDDFYKKIALGGYPELVIEQQKNGYSAVKPWFDKYLTELLKEHEKEYDVAHLRKTLVCLATHVGDLFIIADLAKELNVAEDLLQRSIILLEALFLVHFQQPWLGDVTNYEVDYPQKFYFNDAGLVSFLVGIDAEDELLHQTFFADLLLKNFVITELKKQASWSQKRIQFYYHIGNDKQHQVDLIIEDQQGSIVGIIIKNSNIVLPEDFVGLEHFQEINKEKFVCGVVLYAGQEAMQFNDKLFALPLNALWTV